MSLYDIIHKYPCRHTYIHDKYWYELLSDDELFSKCGSDSEFCLDEYYFKLDDYDTYPDLGTGNILAFNYVWPEYNLTFLKRSITQALLVADKYFLIINLKSYIGNTASLFNIDTILKSVSEFGDNVVVRINISESSSRCKLNNVACHFEQLINSKTLKYQTLWLVQSDEIYDQSNLELFTNYLANNVEENVGYITNPICYINTPNWAVQPQEDFRRLTFLKLSNLSLPFNYDELNLVKSPINFHHMSYVIDQDELLKKFNNWGHRNDVTQDKIGLFLSKFDKSKTDKTVTKLHPVIPEIYDHLEYASDSINNFCFLEYINSFDRKRYFEKIEFDFDQTVSDITSVNLNNVFVLTNSDKQLLYSIVDKMLPSNPRILVIDSLMNGWISAFFSKLTRSFEIYTVTPYNDSNIKQYNFGILQSVKYKFKLYSGIYKIVSAFPNNYFDMIFFSVPDVNLFNQYYIEAWPKIKNYGYVSGIYSQNNEFRTNLDKLLSNHQEHCPWGLTSFNYYEVYLNLSNSLHYNDTTGLWLGRVNK